MANRIQLRRDGAQQWANINPVLAQGELGIEIDTARFKIGDGVTPWNSLRYERPIDTESNTANTLVKRDADGNFEAGAITASLVGNSATATRLANARLISLAGDMSGSGTFDGSQNLTLTAELNYVTSLPHYDANDLTATGTYTQFEVDSRGRIVNAFTPTSIQDYGLDGTTEGSSAQAYDNDLQSLSDLTSFGILSRQGAGQIVTRAVTVGSGRLIVQDGSGQASNPFLDLADTTIVPASYNSTTNAANALISSQNGNETVNATELTVDRYGRLTFAQTVPIATAVEGTEKAVYDNATAYDREDIVKNSTDRLYQAIADISAGGGEPTHLDASDTGSWRYLGTAATPQKGLASFAQEDFDVAGTGHVTIASAGVDNWQLQNNRVSFADGNTKEDFELDQELTATTGYRGFNYLNYVKVNDTSGNLLFSANNVDNSNSGGVDINVDTNISGARIVLDRPGTSPLQTIERTAGNLFIHHNVNSATDRTLDITSNNAGAGTAKINITADDDITLSATNAGADINIEGFNFNANKLATTDATMVLDPQDDDGVSGTVQIRGDLQVDGTTTTVNSVVTTIQDPIITLGGEDTLTSDDNKDRGIDFRYYDSQERFGFFGWDEDYADSNIWNGTGGYRFLYNATNTNEVFAGTDAALIAGNLRLTTNTGSTSTTTGTLVVTGGVGISENIYVGGTVDIASDFDINSGQFTVTASNGNIYTQGDLQVDSNVTLGDASTDTFTVNSDSTFEDDVRISGPNTVFTINDGSVTKFEVDTDNGNTVIQGTVNVVSAVDFDNTLNVDGAVDLNSTLTVDGLTTVFNSVVINAANQEFAIQDGSSVDQFTVDTDNGNTVIQGTLNVESAATFTENVTINGSLTTIGDANTDVLTVNADATFTDDLTVNATVDFDSTLNVDGAVDFNNTLTVDGNSTFFNNVTINGSNKNFKLQDNSNNDQFVINSTSGNVEIGRVGQGTNAVGTLTVHGDGTFNRDVTINGNTTIGDVNTDTLTVNSVTTFTDNATINGDLTVDGNTVLEGNLTVNGSTTTINSTTQTLDDPVFTLGGDTAPTQADAKDRGIEFRYYANGAARIGFFGWDNSAGRYTFLEGATNSSEAFSGTRAGINAGALKLFDATNTSSVGTGALVVGGGAGVGLDLRVGQDFFLTRNADIDGTLDVQGTGNITGNFSVNSNKFNVTASSGNTTIAGTLGVSGATTLSSTLGVTGATTLSSTLAVTSNSTIGGTLGVTGVTTLTGSLVANSSIDANSTLSLADFFHLEDVDEPTIGLSGDTYVIQSSDYGSFRFDGGGYVEGDTLFNSDIYLNGELIQKDNASAAFSRTNYLEVRYKFRSGTRAAYTPSYAEHDTSNLRVYGGGGISTDLHVGEDFFVGKKTSSDTIQFSVLGASGNTDIAGTLDVGGATTITGALTANAGITTTSIAASGNINVNSGQFIINSTAGNVTSNGSATFDGNIVSTTGYVRATNVGARSIFDILQANSTLSVAGAATFSNDLTLDQGGGFLYNAPTTGAFFRIVDWATQTTTFEITPSNGNTTCGALTSSGLTVNGNVSVTGTSSFTGQITGNVTGDLTGTADKSDLVEVSETATSNLTFFPAFVSANNGYTEIRTDSQNFTYQPSSNTLTVSNFVSQTDFEVQGNLNITGNILYGQSQVGDISNHDTDALSEGVSNLYFTDERVDDRVAALISGGTGISASYDDLGNLLTLSAVPADINTDNLTEGSTNLFTTAARTRSHVSESGDLNYNQSTGVFSVTTFSGAYGDLTGTPSLATVATSGAYSDLTGTPTLATVATSGSYNDLLNLPTLFSGAYADLTGKPTLGTAAAAETTDFATAAQGTTADDTDSDLDQLYTDLVAIGNDATITNITQLKAALAALVRP